MTGGTGGDPRAELAALTSAVRRMAALEREAGLDALPGTPAPPPPTPHTSHTSPPPQVSDVESQPSDTAPQPPRAAAPPPHETATTLVRALDLPPDALVPFGDLPGRVDACRRCPLGEERTRAVFGEGSARARLVFCGEAPGRDEDLSARPFVGSAGELLTRMIENGLKIPREDVFILNALKCRPPRNRTPTPDEVAACLPHLEEQLAVLRPEVIVALGNPACRALLGDVGGITRIRGRVFRAFGTQVVPTYHPAYLLRNPGAKAEAWADLKLVMRLLAAGPAEGPAETGAEPGLASEK